MLNTLRLYNELRQTMDAQAAEKLAEVLGWMYEDLRNTVTRTEFNELKEIVRALAEAQQRTEQRIEELTVAQRGLAEAQQRTELRVEELAAAQQRTEQRLEELAAAQQRTEQQVRELAAAQQRTEQQVRELAAAQQRTEQQVRELAAAQQRTEQQVRELAAAQQRTEQQVRELAAAQQRTEQQVRELAAAQQRTEQRLEDLIAVQQRFEVRLERLENKMAQVDGRTLEQQYRERAPAYLGRLLRETRVIGPSQLQKEIEPYLSDDELADAMLTDMVLSGQPRYQPQVGDIWLAVEISSAVDVEDVARAVRRAALLRRAGRPVIPMVAGERMTPDGEEEARRQKVAMLQDGHTSGWDEALAEWAPQIP